MAASYAEFLLWAKPGVHFRRRERNGDLGPTYVIKEMMTDRLVAEEQVPHPNIIVLWRGDWDRVVRIDDRFERAEVL